LPNDKELTIYDFYSFRKFLGPVLLESATFCFPFLKWQPTDEHTTWKKTAELSRQLVGIDVMAVCMALEK
jgi:hypothetical protein